MNYDKILSEIFFDDDWHLNPSYLGKYKRNYKKRKKYQNIIDYINNRYDDSESFKETLYRMRHKYIGRPVCKTCGGKVRFVGKGGRLFGDFCCNRCAGKHPETIAKKQEGDRLKNNGKLGWNKNTPEKIQHRKDTLIAKYGSLEVANKEIFKLMQKTVRERYGVDSISQLEEIKQKRINTVKATYKYNKSKLEDKAYELLKEKFNDIERQYYSEQYPWACDFYIKSIDTYIECQFSQYHHGYPYTGSEEDLKEIELLRESSERRKKETGKDKSQYDAVIYTWSDLDVRKRETAKMNNLNFLEFYSINDLNDWLVNIC